MSIFGPKVPDPVAPPKLPSRASFITRGRGFGPSKLFPRRPNPVISANAAPTAKPSLIGK